MDHVTIEEENVAERYLMGQLTASEVTRFEEHYLDCPECLERLELSKRLCQGLKEIAAEEGTRLARTALLAWLARRGPALQAVLGLALLTVVIVPWALLAPEVSRLSGEHEWLAGELAQALAPQTRTPVFSLSPERSGPTEEPSTRITLRSTPEWVVLALQLPPSQSSAKYRVRLLGARGEPLWQSGQIEGDAAGRVTLSVHSTWLEASSYLVELDALTPTGEPRPVARFAFGVRRGE